MQRYIMLSCLFFTAHAAQQRSNSLSNILADLKENDQYAQQQGINDLRHKLLNERFSTNERERAYQMLTEGFCFYNTQPDDAFIYTGPWAELIMIAKQEAKDTKLKNNISAFLHPLLAQHHKAVEAYKKNQAEQKAWHEADLPTKTAYMLLSPLMHYPSEEWQNMKQCHEKAMLCTAGACMHLLCLPAYAIKWSCDEYEDDESTYETKALSFDKLGFIRK